MKQGRILHIIELLVVVVLFGIALHAPITVFLGSVFPSIEVEVKAWKEIILLITGILTLVYIHITRRWVEVLHDRLIQLSLGYITLHLLLAVVANTGLLSTMAGLMIDLRFIALFLITYVVVRYDAHFIKHIVKAVVVGAVIVIGFGLLQLSILPHDSLRLLGYNQETIRPFTTIDRNPDFIRIQSTTRGPNPLGALMIIYLAALVAYLARYRHILQHKKAIGISAAVIGVCAVLLASYSRSAIIGALVACVLVGAVMMRFNIKVFVTLTVMCVLGGVGFLQLQTTDFYSNVILHEDPESPVKRKSNSEHLRSLQEGITRVIDEPLGAGVGSTGSASLYDDTPGPIIENQYLFIAHEAGWLGLLLFMAIYIMVLWQLWCRRDSWLALSLFASGIGLGLVGMLLPVWADETVALTWWGLAGGIIGSRYDKRTRQ